MFQIMPATGVALLRRELPDEPIPARRLEDVGLGAWIAGALLAELRDHLGLLQDEAFPDDWRRVLSGYNLGEPKVQGGTRNAAYEDRVVNWIKSRGSDIAALVPVEAVTV